MKTKKHKLLIKGSCLVAAFCIWTALVLTVDVQPVGVNGTAVGFATLNSRIHSMTGVNMKLYMLTDCLSIIPVLVCVVHGFMGAIQAVKNRSIFRVEKDIIYLGFYYVAVIACYLLFEIFPVNYRPVLISGIMEASYPSSTTLLVLSVMQALSFQCKKWLADRKIIKAVEIFSTYFSAGMVLGRFLSGVHWVTDIIGAVLLSSGLFSIYKGVALTER